MVVGLNQPWFQRSQPSPALLCCLYLLCHLAVFPIALQESKQDWAFFDLPSHLGRPSVVWRDVTNRRTWPCAKLARHMGSFFYLIKSFSSGDIPGNTPKELLCMCVSPLEGAARKATGQPKEKKQILASGHAGNPKATIWRVCPVLLFDQLLLM